MSVEKPERVLVEKPDIVNREVRECELRCRESVVHVRESVGSVVTSVAN